MKRTSTRRALTAVGLTLLAWMGACSSNPPPSSSPDESNGSPPPSDSTPAPPAMTVQSGVIDVAPDSHLTLALRGGLGPIVDGQTLTKAVVSIDDVQLVSSTGAARTILAGTTTADLLSLQNDLDQLVGGQAIDAGQFSQIRFRLRSVFVQTIDGGGAARVYASENVDLSQFAQSVDVHHLELHGVGADGFISVAIPESGISVHGSATLALHFALAESLSVLDNGAWVLEPDVWVVDAGIFSTIDVQLDLSSDSFAHELSQGYTIMLLDANLRPFCSAPLSVVSSTLLRASFKYLEYFEGPFVAVLLPPPGVSLSSAVATSIDVHQSARVEASVTVSSVQRTQQTVDIRTGTDARCIERSPTGQVTSQMTRPIGTVDRVAPRGGAHEPLRSGERPRSPAPPPALPGVPSPNQPSRDAGAPPTPALDAGAPPPIADASVPPPPSQDAGAPQPPRYDDAGVPTPPRRDAGVPTPPPPWHYDAGSGWPPPPPWWRDASAPTPPPWRSDAGATLSRDGGR